jgi:cytochrome c biogenesis protein CcmG/thiol:disulfide interchange protein DsbE
LKLKIVTSALVVLAVVLTAIGCSPGPDTGQALAEGDLAPGFTLPGLDGKEVSLEDFRCGPVVLNFWATRCEPCRQEMPFLQEISADPEWTERGLVVLPVNLGEPAALVRGFMNDNRLTFTVLLDSNREVWAQYNMRYIPTTYFIDKDGIIRSIKIGAFARKSDIDRTIINMLTNGESQGG